LIAAVLDVPRFWPSGNKSRALAGDESLRIRDAAGRLALGMPLAYAARRAAFRTLSLYVDERVLIPRPETEVLVDLVLDITKGTGTVIDVGTGSGAIALALAVEGMFSQVVGTDVSGDALAVAEMNAEVQSAKCKVQRLGMCPVEFRLGSYLAACSGDQADVIVSNPPYISRDEAGELPAAVREWEPEVALFADDNGMAAIAAIAAQAKPILRSGGLLALEVDSRRAGRASELVTGIGGYHDVAIRPDLTGRARFVLARRTEG
jgi:release factor glutamine methyltransferase